MTRRPPRSTLFPCTTLFRSQQAGMPFPGASHARGLLAATVGRGHAEDDYAAIIEAVEGLAARRRSEEHTSELQSRRELVCRPLPEKNSSEAKGRRWLMISSI